MLVVDADRVVLEMLQIRLDVAGYHPLAARTGAGGLKILRNMRPAVLVLDAAVAEMGAFDLLSLIQRDRARLACPILLTGKKLGAEGVRRAATLGGDLHGQTLQRRGCSGTDRQDAKAGKAWRAARPCRSGVVRGVGSAGIPALAGC